MPRRRVIDQLRRQYPGEWHFENPCFWHHEAGWYVHACTCSIPNHYDAYVTRYFRSDTSNEVFLDGTGATVVVNGVSLVFGTRTDHPEPNRNHDLLLIGHLQGVEMLTDKPRSKVRHCDIKAPVKTQPSVTGPVHITNVTWFCSECHAELPGEHKADCCLIRKIMAGVRG